MSYYFFSVKLYQIISLFIVHNKINFLCSQKTRNLFAKLSIREGKAFNQPDTRETSAKRFVNLFIIKSTYNICEQNAKKNFVNKNTI